MVAQLQAVSPLQSLARAFITPTNVQSVALWGSAAGLTAFWLVQPFDWIKAQLGLNKPAEE